MGQFKKKDGYTCSEVSNKEIAEGKRISGWSEFWLKCMYTHTSLVYELRTFEFDSFTGTCIQFQ